jgi:hypothetical protein
VTNAQPPSDPAVLAVVDRYRTCEFATLSRSGVPIAWPTSPLLRPDGTLLITTSIGLPQKAHNIRRDPRVALLFSEPTASGLDGAPQVLVQGTAVCPDEIVTDVSEEAEYWRRLTERQPINRMYSATPLSRRLFDWYYMRLHITVTPTAWSTRPPLGPGPVTATAGAPEGIVADALRRFATFPSAVLASRTEDGGPTLRRIRVTGPGADGGLALAVPDDADLRPGPAGLLSHSHDDKLWNLRSVGVVGELRSAGGGWALRPERIIGGVKATPISVARQLAGLRRTARGYLEKRSLPRPEIAWDSIREVKRDVTGAGRAPRREAAEGPPSSR